MLLTATLHSTRSVDSTSGHLLTSRFYALFWVGLRRGYIVIMVYMYINGLQVPVCVTVLILLNLNSSFCGSFVQGQCMYYWLPKTL